MRLALRGRWHILNGMPGTLEGFDKPELAFRQHAGEHGVIFALLILADGFDVNATSETKISKKSARAPKRRPAKISKPSKSKSTKQEAGRGPGRPKLFSEKIVVIVPRHQVDQLDVWRAKQHDKPNRAETIRRLIAAGLRATQIDLPPDLLIALDTWRMSRPVPAWMRSGPGRVVGVCTP